MSYKLFDYLSIIYPNSQNFHFIDDKNVNIDLSNACNHLGDTILFAPLISGLIDAGYHVRVNDNFHMYEKLFNIEPILCEGFFIGRSYNREDRARIGKDGLINFYSLPALPIAQSIHNRFLPATSYKTSLNSVVSRLRLVGQSSSLSLNLDRFNSYVLVSPATNSRSFGFYPNQIKTNSDFISTVSTYKNNKSTIIKIGSKSLNTTRIEKDLARYVDIDLSGKTQWYDLLGLLINKKFNSIVTYDTFTYHLAVLLGCNTDLFNKSWLSKSEFNWISKRFTPGF
ncbi:hypothetical protein [Polynucleobacter asymbioticus]|uniref:hypothetical protein n=1 Tax=Polynucleobacter asymbioticus TaxID=576611 RepID=UPI0008F8830A|nr:hypothetical protein [Polynucleobacter asymbioticus]